MSRTMLETNIAAAPLTRPLISRETAVIKLAMPENGLSLRLDANDGAYEISSSESQWVFAGSFKMPLAEAMTNQGKDLAGAYHQVSFAWNDGGTPMTGWIRLYSE